MNLLVAKGFNNNTVRLSCDKLDMLVQKANHALQAFSLASRIMNYYFDFKSPLHLHFCSFCIASMKFAQACDVNIDVVWTQLQAGLAYL